MIDDIEIDLTSSARQTQYASSNLNSCNFGGADGKVYAGTAGTCEISVNNNGHTTKTAGTVQDFSPGALSSIAVPGFANGVAVNGDFAYVAAGSAGLQVVALGRDRSVPTLLANLDLAANANDIALNRNRAYLATSDGLKVVDISAPASPRLLGSFVAIGNAMGVKVRDTIAYVIAGDSLHVINVTDPEAMVQLGSIKLTGTAWNLDVDLTRNLVAVAMGESGMSLVDISHLSAPVLRGTILTGDAHGVALRGNTAIVADYAMSMTTVDISNLSAPTILSSIPPSQGGPLNNVILSGNFALGTNAAFFNGISIIDISDPQSLQLRTTINLSDPDANGINIAADDNYVYLAADRSSQRRGGASGDSRLYIGKYQPNLDLAGIVPTAEITAPANNTSVYEGDSLTVTVDAHDDVTVAAVSFLVNGQPAFISTSAPYRYTFPVPIGASSLELSAVARDLGGNEGTATPITINVAPDPMTQAIGQVVGADGTPLSGAIVTAPGGRTGVTDTDGHFQILDVPTVSGNLVLQATYTPLGSFARQGSSSPTHPERAGVTDVGEISVIDVRFETDYGVLQTSCEFCGIRRTLPFTFPYYGANGSTVIIYSGGAINLLSPAGTNNGYIYAFWGPMIGSGGVLINDRLSGRYIVTYDRMRHFREGGSNTVQVHLFQNGRIVFAFKGITALRDYVMTGMVPKSATSIVSAVYSTKPTFDVPAHYGVFDGFTPTAPFDLDNGFVVFTPTAGGGYSVHTILPSPSPPSTTLSGAFEVTAPQAAPTQLRATAQNKTVNLSTRTLANAEVRVTSSGNPNYLGMTNTDAQGRFTLKGVPPGGINVEIWRNGLLIGRGIGLSGTDRSTTELLKIDLASPKTQPKN